MRETDAGGRGWAFTLLPGGRGLELTIPRELETPNRDRGRHWSAKHRATRAWEELIAIFGGGRLAPFRLIEGERVVVTREKGPTIKFTKRKERRRVTITRYVGSARQLLKDADNLRYVSKPVLDALTRLGLIYDDAQQWTEHPAPTQAIAPDGSDYTVIRIERLTDGA